jgi:hypothetical protein
VRFLRVLALFALGAGADWRVCEEDVVRRTGRGEGCEELEDAVDASKEQKAWAELCFMARAMEEKLAPSRPWADERFDIGVDYKRLRSRVQVKSTV